MMTNIKRHIGWVPAVLLAGCFVGVEDDGSDIARDGEVEVAEIEFDAFTLPQAEGADTEVPLLTAREAVSYIVTFHDDDDGADAIADFTTRYPEAITHRYTRAMNGFTAELTEEEVEELRNDPAVALVEENKLMYAVGTQDTRGIWWGLDRSDQSSLPLNDSYSYPSEGSGTHVYVLDTGVELDNPEFSGRTGNGFTCTCVAFKGRKCSQKVCSADGGDWPGTYDASRQSFSCSPHGTHVAGTVGGTYSGVAKKTTLHSVRILDCNGSGTISDIVAGIDWVIANAQKPAVINMSLGGGASSTLDNAVNKAINAGITVVVAAGNSNADACNSSPARVANAITVAASSSNDARASFSNWGSCVDIHAPGDDIYSTMAGNHGYVMSMDGTSMAAPHVAGAAAMYLDGNTSASPSTVATALSNASVLNKITDAKGSPNKLLQVQSL